MYIATFQACLSTQETNSVTSIIPDAQDVAEALVDVDNFANTQLLYGLPVSVKECMHTKVKHCF